MKRNLARSYHPAAWLRLNPERSKPSSSSRSTKRGTFCGGTAMCEAPNISRAIAHGLRHPGTELSAERQTRVHPNAWRCPIQSNGAPGIHEQPYSCPMQQPVLSPCLQRCLRHQQFPLWQLVKVRRSTGLLCQIWWKCPKGIEYRRSLPPSSVASTCKFAWPSLNMIPGASSPVIPLAHCLESIRPSDRSWNASYTASNRSWSEATDEASKMVPSESDISCQILSTIYCQHLIYFPLHPPWLHRLRFSLRLSIDLLLYVRVVVDQNRRHRKKLNLLSMHQELSSVREVREYSMADERHPLHTQRHVAVVSLSCFHGMESVFQHWAAHSSTFNFSSLLAQLASNAVSGPPQ